MDIIYIRDLRIETVIGVYDWERYIRQTVRIDLDMASDTSKAAGSDNLSDTLSYHEVASRLTEFVSHSDFLLIETLAERIASLILAEFPTPWLRLTLGKPGAVPGAREVGIVIERGAKP
jgi:dihydroneopterin aldolase